MSWFSGKGSGNYGSTAKMASAAKSAGTPPKSSGQKGSNGTPFSSKPGKGPGSKSGKK